MTSPTGNLNELKAIITGAGGFLGSLLTEALLKAGASVIALDRPEIVSKLKVDGRPLKILEGSFEESQEELGKLLSDSKRTVFIHLAGISLAGECARNPEAAFQGNVELTFKALEFCRRHHIRLFVFPSTSLVYGDRGVGSHSESETPPLPLNLYAATKLAAEALIGGYAASFGLNALIIRLGNIYGTRSNPDSVLGLILSQIREGKNIELMDLSPVRDFIYVDDAIDGFLHLISSLEEERSLTVNLGTGIGTSIKDLASTACRVAAHEAQISQKGPARNDPPSQIILNIDLLRRQTQWEPQFSLEKGLSIILKDA